MKILVTGGCGFIGSNFIRYILNKYPDYNIVNLDDLTYAGNKDSLKDIENDERYYFIKGNICDKEILDEIVPKVDVIVHFAAETHVDRSILDANCFVKTNVVGTQILLDAARKYGNKRFHHVSTDEVFGSVEGEAKFNENLVYSPRSPYAASKAAADHLVRSYFHTYGLPITISSCSNNYGPYQFPEKLIPLFITNLIEGKKVPLYGTGVNVRDWLHVLDHCEALDIVLHKGKIGESYCIGGDCEKSNLEVTKNILEIFGFGEEMIKNVVDRKGHDLRYATDISKIKHELGWSPKISFEQGLKETVLWYQKNESWWKKIKERVVVDITDKSEKMQENLNEERISQRAFEKNGMSQTIESSDLRGVILAGGKGTRLYPLTKVTNKHLLPVGSEPMIFNPIHKLIEAGIKEIMVISSTDQMGSIVNLLGSGEEFGCKFTYRVQEKPDGIAAALKLAEDFSKGKKIVVILGDNITTGSIVPFIEDFKQQKSGAKVVLKQVKDPKRYGIATLFRDEAQVIEIEEKPDLPKSSYAVVGYYMYDSSVFEIINSLIPSPRGEYEITDVNNAYIKRGDLSYGVLEGEWIDAGTIESLHLASEMLIKENKGIIKEKK